MRRRHEQVLSKLKHLVVPGRLDCAAAAVHARSLTEVSQVRNALNSKNDLKCMQAKIKAIERHLTLGSVRQHASVTVSGLGILSLPLRPLFPTRLVTGDEPEYSVALV